MEPDYLRGVTSAKIVHSILEDSKVNMWFATNEGAFICDGKSLSNLSEKDGLSNNTVNGLLYDKGGAIWFATHHQDVSYWDGTSFTQVTVEDGVQGTEDWDICADRSGNVWFPTEHQGVYRYDGESYINFHDNEGLTTGAVQCVYEDREGRIWIGVYGGVFRYDGETIFRVGKDGPWGE